MLRPETATTPRRSPRRAPRGAAFMHLIWWLALTPPAGGAGRDGGGWRRGGGDRPSAGRRRSEEHTSELQSLMRISYAVFCLKKKKTVRIDQQYKQKSTHTTKQHCTEIYTEISTY